MTKTRALNILRDLLCKYGPGRTLPEEEASFVVHLAKNNPYLNLVIPDGSKVHIVENSKSRNGTGFELEGKIKTKINPRKIVTYFNPERDRRVAVSNSGLDPKAVPWDAKIQWMRNGRWCAPHISVE